MVSLNIVLTTDYFPPHVGGGVERVTFHLGSELVRLGHKVAVVTLNTRSAQPYEILDGMHIYRARPIELTQALRTQSVISLEILGLIRRVFRKEAADILHAHNLFFFTTIAACLTKRQLRTRLVTTVHVGSVSQLQGLVRFIAALYEKSLGRWILDQSDHVVAVSGAVEQYVRNLGIPSAKICVVPNAVDLEEFTPAALERKVGRVQVAFIGRLIANKGPQYLLEAAPQILHKFPNVQFLFVGEGPMRRQLKYRATELGVDKNTRFLGTVSKVSEFLRNCDVLVRPSLTDGMPLTVLEAMACGIPNVASRVGGTPEILQHGQTGYLVEPKEVEQLSFYISRLVEDRHLRSSMGKAARSSVEKFSNWSEVARRMTIIYESVLAST